MLAHETLPDSAPGVRLAIRRLPARRALDWLASGWHGFRRTPAPLAVASITLLLVAVLAGRAAGWLPLLLLTVYLGIVAATVRMADQGEVILAGSGAWRSARLWGLAIVIVLLGAVLNGLLAGSAVLALKVLTHLPTGGFLAVLASLILVRVLVILVLAGCWLAPALIVNRNASVLQALHLSLAGSFRNAGAFLLVVVPACGLLALAALPLGLGLVVVLPLLACAAMRAADDIVADAY